MMAVAFYTVLIGAALLLLAWALLQVADPHREFVADPHREFVAEAKANSEQPYPSGMFLENGPQSDVELEAYHRSLRPSDDPVPDRLADDVIVALRETAERDNATTWQGFTERGNS